MKIFIHTLTIAFGVLYVFFISKNVTSAVEPKRDQIKNPKVWKEIEDINQTLLVPSHPKDLSIKEQKWAGKFVLTLKHWFAVLKSIQDSELFKQKVGSIEKKNFNAWITGGYSYYFEMTYRIPDTDIGQVWNMVIYYIVADGLDTATIKLNDNIKPNPNITYEMSQQQLPLPDNSGYAYRIDKVYTAAVTIYIKLSEMKIVHEIVEDGETPQYQYYTRKKTVNAVPGVLGILVSELQVDATLVLTEIDKRFVIERVENAENTDNAETTKNADTADKAKNADTADNVKKVKYYFQQPVIQDLRIKIGSVTRYATDYQEKEGFSKVNIPAETLTDQQRLDLKKELIGTNLDVAKADKIYDDFIAMLVSTDQNVHAEFVNRIKVALVNRFARPVMTSPSITALGKQIDLSCFYYDYPFPIEYDAEEMLSYRKIFYMSYSIDDLLKGLMDIIATCDTTDTEKRNEKAENLLEKQTAAAGDDIFNDGYDFEQDFEAAHQKFVEEETQRQKAAQAAEIEETQRQTQRQKAARAAEIERKRELRRSTSRKGTRQSK